MSVPWLVDSGRHDVVVFAGRHDIDSSSVITEGLPRTLAAHLPSHWVIADPLAFPWEQLSPRQSDVPMDVILPDDWGPDALIGTFGRPLFEQMSSFDALVARPAVWSALRRRYCWSEAQFRRPTGRVNGTVRQLVAKAHVVRLLSNQLALNGADLHAWPIRTTRDKAAERASAAAVDRIISKALSQRPKGGSATTVDFTNSGGRYLTAAMRHGAMTTAVRSDRPQAAHVEYCFPEVRTMAPGLDGTVDLGVETTDLVIVDTLSMAEGDGAPFARMRPLWRAVRIGGTMLAIHRLIAPHSKPLKVVHELLVEGTGGTAILDSIETARDPSTGRSTTGFISYTKIGVPCRL